MKQDFPEKALARASSLELMLFDVDGVLTDGLIYIDDDGRETKAFCSTDGAGIKALSRMGVATGVITGRRSNVVDIRAAELGMKIIIQGAKDKLDALKQVLADTGLDPFVVGFMGDDLVDLPILTRVGFSAAPANAHPAVKKHVDYVTENFAGFGAAREAVELILRAKGLYDAFLSRYLTMEGDAKG
ncbi:MAG TPA: phenylphosphate carboxylase subunit delta [Planctomycetes bacterium]|nr:phenylphosphate carboxylase subunit delta [Planctomycetota bacterium]